MAHNPEVGGSNPSPDPEASTLASARESPGACETQQGLPQAGAAREATEAAARSPSNPGMDDRRSRGRSAHTRRCSRPRYGRSRCGPAGGAGPHRCRDRADRRAGVSRPPQARYAGTGHGDRGDAVRRQPPDGQPVRYPSQGQRRQDCSRDSPPGSRSCHYRGSGAATLLSPHDTRRPRKRHVKPGRIMPDHMEVQVSSPEPAVGVSVPPGTRQARLLPQGNRLARGCDQRATPSWRPSHGCGVFVPAPGRV